MERNFFSLQRHNILISINADTHANINLRTIAKKAVMNVLLHSLNWIIKWFWAHPCLCMDFLVSTVVFYITRTESNKILTIALMNENP